MELSIKTFLNLKKLRLVFVSNRKELFRLPRPSTSGSNLLLGAQGGSVCSRIWEGEIWDLGVYKGMPLTVYAVIATSNGGNCLFVFAKKACLCSFIP